MPSTNPLKTAFLMPLILKMATAAKDHAMKKEETKSRKMTAAKDLVMKKKEIKRRRTTAATTAC